jgi:zinc D-Ala-D-Ala carboxypeptidase
MNISEHISFKEATFSATAIRKGILNVPDEVQLKNMQILADKVFEPLRLGLGGKPIHISSFFRSWNLNILIGGSPSSQHLCNRGAAMDLDNIDPSNTDIFNFINDNLEFDQLISEYPNEEGVPSWVHVSYNKDNNRNEVLMCINGNYHKI